jgi:hypothetical protein
LLYLIAYIHCNPEKHGFVENFRDWPYSSYSVILSSKPSLLKRDELLAWFAGPVAFKKAHELENEREIDYLIRDDDF